MSREIFVRAGTFRAWWTIGLRFFGFGCMVVGGPIAWVVYDSHAFAGWVFCGAMIAMASGQVTICDADDPRLTS
jgi:hypothetical protein